MVQLDGLKKIRHAAYHHKDTRDAVRKKGREVEGKARANLAKARASTQWSKIHGPDHLTSVGSEGSEQGPDVFVTLNAPNAMAIEMGHAPSGVFAGTPTKAPHGLYILTRAAGLAGINLTPNA